MLTVSCQLRRAWCDKLRPLVLGWCLTAFLTVAGCAVGDHHRSGECVPGSGESVAAGCNESSVVAGGPTTTKVAYIPMALHIDVSQTGFCNGATVQLATKFNPDLDDLALGTVRILRYGSLIATFKVRSLYGTSGNVVLDLVLAQGPMHVDDVGIEPVIVEICMQSGFSRLEERPLAFERS